MQAPAALQIGVVPEHCALLEHCTQVCVVALQAGLAPTQRTRSELVHSTQLPAPTPTVMHAGAATALHACDVPDPRSPSQGTQAPPTHSGFAPEHAASVRHSTHVFLVVSHVGAAPMQSPLPRHATQVLVASLQRGVAAKQLASLEHPAVQVWAARLQMPFAPTHWAFDVHWTHVLVAVSQTERPGGHAVVFVALHSKHFPATHAGSSTSGHSALCPLPWSPLQPTQTPAAVSQSGVDPTQALGSAAVHWTHLLVVVLQTLFMPTHRTVSDAVHSTHLPDARSQAGATVVGQAALAAVPLSPLHATHASAALQTGVAPLQLADVLHCTQLFVTVSQKGFGAVQSGTSVRHATQAPLALHRGVSGVPAH